MKNSNELVTIIVCTYNQENTIKEAIESAFNQNYSPLEIIISDDCSTDSTYDVIKSTVSMYTGPHTVTVNQNSSNLGIARHWDTISRKAKGRLIVHAAGDDISYPERVSELYLAWSSTKPRPILLSSNGISMTIDGKDKSPLIKIPESNNLYLQDGPINLDFDILSIYVIGFSLAVDSRLYERLDPLERWMWSEDDILRSRALILGRIGFLPKVLVRYRDGGLSKGAYPSQHAYIKRFKDQAMSRLNYLHQIKKDYFKVHGRSDLFINNLEKKITFASNRLNLVSNNNIIFSTYFLAWLLFNYRNEGISRKQIINTFMVRWLPRLFFAIKNLTIYIKGSIFK